MQEMKNFWKKFRVPVIIILIIALLGLWFYKMTDQSKIGVTFYDVSSDKVSNSVRIVQLADLHMKDFGNNNEQLVTRVADLKPDIIACTGDMNNDEDPNYDVVINLFKQLVDIAPVYYAYGNNEAAAIWVNDSNIGDDLNDIGVHVLHNKSEIVTVGDTKINIGGLTESPEQFDKYGGREFMDKYISESYFKLLLVHYPEEFTGTLDSYDIDLALCGHAHGGQARLPFIGGLYSTGQGWFPKLTEGYHESGSAKFIISRGLGNNRKVPRFNNPPELTVIDLGWY